MTVKNLRQLIHFFFVWCQESKEKIEKWWNNLWIIKPNNITSLVHPPVQFLIKECLYKTTFRIKGL